MDLLGTISGPRRIKIQRVINKEPKRNHKFYPSL